MPLYPGVSISYLEDQPPLLKERGVGFIADNSIFFGPPEVKTVEIEQLWNDKQGTYLSIKDIVDKGNEVGFILEDGSGKTAKNAKGDPYVPGILSLQKYWRLIYPPKVNNLTTDIEDQIVISTDYSQTTSSEASSGSEGSVSADIGFLSSSISASYTTQVSTSQGIEKAYTQSEEGTKNFTFPAQTAIAIWQKVQVIQLEYQFPILIKSEDAEEFNEMVDGMGFFFDEVQDIFIFKPSKIIVEPVIVQSYIDCCPVSELPVKEPS